MNVLILLYLIWKVVNWHNFHKINTYIVRPVSFETVFQKPPKKIQKILNKFFYSK